MRSFFFQNDGVVLDCSVRSRERTIVPQERRLVLVQRYVCNRIEICLYDQLINPVCIVQSELNAEKIESLKITLKVSLSVQKGPNMSIF